MINWYELAISSLWILGLTELLATLSIAHWFASLTSASLVQVLSGASFRIPTILGVSLFTAGMLLSASTWWERAGWAAVLILTMIEGRSTWKDWHTRPMKDSE